MQRSERRQGIQVEQTPLLITKDDARQDEVPA